MTKQKVFSILSTLGLITLVVGVAIVLFSPEAIAAYDSSDTKQIMEGSESNQFVGGNNQSTVPLSAPPSVPDINNSVVGLVMQPGQDKLHAFNALTGEWTTLEGSDIKIADDDIAIVSNIAILVAQPGQDALHAFSAHTSEWATLDGPNFRVGPDDIFKVKDSVIIVMQPGQEKIHAYSALTGEWATLGGVGFTVAPSDKLFIGPEN